MRKIQVRSLRLSLVNEFGSFIFELYETSPKHKLSKDYESSKYTKMRNNVIFQRDLPDIESRANLIGVDLFACFGNVFKNCINKDSSLIYFIIWL